MKEVKQKETKTDDFINQTHTGKKVLESIAQLTSATDAKSIQPKTASKLDNLVAAMKDLTRQPSSDFLRTVDPLTFIGYLRL